MTALRRTHGKAAQHMVEQGRQRARVGLARAFWGGSLHLGEKVGGGMPLMPGPDRVRRQRTRLFPQRRQLGGQAGRVGEGGFQRLQNGARGRPPGAHPIPQAAMPVVVLRQQQQVDAVQPGLRTRAAQQQVQAAHALQPGKPRFAAHHQRMLEQRQQRHRREAFGHRFRHRDQQSAGRQA